MYRILFFFIGIVSLVGLASCSSDNEILQQDFGYDYFPLEIGNFREYKVSEVIFLTSGPDTSRFFLKEEVVDSIINENQISFILESSSRLKMNDPWKVDSLWTARITTREAIQIENNVPILKIQFPVEGNKSWDSNLFNTKDETIFSSLLVDSDTLENQVLKVLIADIPENIVLKDQRSEYYSKGIGLIKRDFVTLNFCTVNCERAMQVESGRVLNQNLINYGKN